MERIDALLYSITFYAYLASFVISIFHVALKKENLGRIAMIIARKSPG